MIERHRNLRVLIWLGLVAVAAAAGQSAACNDAPLVNAPACRPGSCSCEEDPTQSICKAFNEPAEGGKDPDDANPLDAPVDTLAPADAGDAGDAPD